MAAAQFASLGPEGIEDARFLEGWREESGAVVAAIRVDLTPGWHTYWRVPGETGIPPQFDWSASENLAALSYEWPRPHIFEQDGMRYFGYEGALTLPVRLVPQDPSEPIVARVDLFLGVCKDICLPGNAEIASTLPSGAASDEAEAIRDALHDRALTAAEAGVSLVKCSLSPSENGLELTAELVFDAPPTADQFALIESSNPALWIGRTQSSVDGSRLTTRAHVSGGDSSNVMIDRKEIRLSVLDHNRVVDIPGCATRG